MNCSSCGTSFPRGFPYCPTCKKPAPYATTGQGGAYSSATYNPGSTVTASPYGSQQMPQTTTSPYGYASSPKDPRNAPSFPSSPVDNAPSPAPGQTGTSPFPQNSYASFAQNGPAPFQQTSSSVPDRQTGTSPFQQYPYNLLGNDNQSANSYGSTANQPPQQSPYARPTNQAHNPNPSSLSVSSKLSSFANQPPQQSSHARPANPAHNPNPSSLSVSSKLSSFANQPPQQSPYAMPATAMNNASPATFFADSTSSAQNSYAMPMSTGNSYPSPPPFGTVGNPSTSTFAPTGNTLSAQSPYSMSAGFSSTTSPFENSNNIPGFTIARSNSQALPAGVKTTVATSKNKKKGKLFFGIAAVAFVLVVGVAVFMFINNTSQAAVTTSVAIKPGAPSGKAIVPTAAAIIANPQTSTGIDNNYQPTNVIKTFTTQQTVYVTFNVDSKKQPGYLEAKWYGNNQLVTSDKFAHNPQNNVAYFTENYNSATSGAVELYWCTKADCSDEQLAQVLKFTVTAGSMVPANSAAIALRDIDNRAA